jgi:pimeloyl-ACP methyl ester carboxylesterase
MLGVHRHFPFAMRLLFRVLYPFARVHTPTWVLLLLRGALVGPDKATLADPEISRMCYEGFRGAWGLHRDGVFEDAQLYTQPWGFALEEIRVPVCVWHGTEDRNFSHSLAEYAARIPGAEVRIVPGEGHYSLPIRHARKILTQLIGAPVRAL